MVFCVVVEAIISCSENFGDAVVGDFHFLLVVVLSVVANFLTCLVVCIDLGVVVEGGLIVEVFNGGLTCLQGPRGNSFPSPSSLA